MAADPAPQSAAPTEARLRAIVSLLADDSPKVVATCRAALLGLGDAARPLLEQELAAAQGAHGRRLRSVLAGLRFPRADREVLEHLRGKPDLERGAQLLAQLVDGGPEADGVPAALDGLAAQVAARLGGKVEAAARLAALREVLVDGEHLSGVPAAEAVPVDALLHGVLLGRRGLPLPLCMVWILVARRLGIPLVGVNMPGHFLMRLMGPGRPRIFDAFRGGAPVPEAVTTRMLEQYGLEGRSLDDLHCDDLEILLRTLRNLVSLAEADDDPLLRQRAVRLLEAARSLLGR